MLINQNYQQRTLHQPGHNQLSLIINYIQLIVSQSSCQFTFKNNNLSSNIYVLWELLWHTTVYKFMKL